MQMVLIFLFEFVESATSPFQFLTLILECFKNQKIKCYRIVMLIKNRLMQA